MAFFLSLSLVYFTLLMAPFVAYLAARPRIPPLMDMEFSCDRAHSPRIAHCVRTYSTRDGSEDDDV
jgi:hypothetical protein